jgi:death on curing protein
VPDASIAELAATLAWGLVKNHAFIDGNKRIGLAALLVFLRINDHWLNSSEEQARVMILRVAAGEIGEEGWTAWVVDAAAPRQ